MTTARQPIDPALRAYLDGLIPPAGAPQPATEAERVSAARALMLQALASRAPIPGLPNTVAARDVQINGGLTGRLYQPPTAPGAGLVYLHGGGWVLGSVETHDPFCRLLSEAAGLTILSVDYRLAPEHPFPAGLDDTLAAFQWAAEHCAEWNCDASRLAIGGDSAGANLSAAATNRLCAATGPAAPCAQLLLYPATDHPSAGHPSYVENGAGYGLDAERMHWFWRLYAPGLPPDNPDAFPLRNPQLPPLPPAFVATAEYDPLRDEGIAYAAKLREAGVPVVHSHSPDMNHNFPVHPGTVGRFRQSEEALAEIAAWLRATLG
jgi:acetyl esterase